VSKSSQTVDPSAGTNFRVDRVKRLPEGSKYTVPCGMNTIVYLSNKPPSVGSVMSNLPTVLADDEVCIFSKWILHRGEGYYVVCNVERRA
jgi:hypothetical protein